MLVGKLYTTISENYISKTEEYIDISIYKNPFDESIDILEDLEELEPENGYIRIDDEIIPYKYVESINNIMRIYGIIRGYLSSNICQHLCGTLVYKFNAIVTKEYDSQNIRDIKLGNTYVETNTSNTNTVDIKGLDVIIQDIKLTMINIGNKLLNNQSNIESLLNKDWVKSFYIDALANNPFGITDIDIIDLRLQDDNPNKISIIVDVTVNHNIYRNIEILINTRRPI
jgi:hypothetical protein